MTDNNTVAYYPVSVRRLDWSTSRSDILAVRSALEAGLANEQADDAAALHYIASDITDLQVGYLSIGRDGLIRLATSQAEPVADISAALLRFAVMDTPRHGLSQLSAPAGHPWQAALLQLQFSTEHSPDKSTLSLLLPPDRSANATGSPLVRLENLEDFRRFAVTLVEQAHRSVIIFSEDLEAWLYDNDEFAAALMTFVQRSRNSNVHILIRDTRPLLLHGHRLLRASHRASDKIAIRRLPTIQSEKHPCYLIVDDNGLLFRQDPQVVQGIGYTDYRARARPLLEQFEQLWARSGTDPDLRSHTV